MAFEGITTALVTPLDAQIEVDEKALAELIDFQIKSGVHNLLALGGTGEYSSLSNAQRKQVIDITIREVNGRVPVMVGIVDPGIGDAIDIGSYAKEAGADGLLIVTPFYVRPTQEGIVEYYKKLDAALDLPILLYNMPAKTGVNMLPNTVETIVKETKNVVGIKECSVDFAQTVELIRLVGDKISVLAGEEYAAVASMIFGAKGAIMASANVIPEVWMEFYDLIQKGETEKAIGKNFEAYPMFNAIFLEGNPGPLKAAMKLRGLTTEQVNIPLLNAKDSTVAALKKILPTVEV